MAASKQSLCHGFCEGVSAMQVIDGIVFEGERGLAPRCAGKHKCAFGVRCSTRMARRDEGANLQVGKAAGVFRCLAHGHDRTASAERAMSEGAVLFRPTKALQKLEYALPQPLHRLARTGKAIVVNAAVMFVEA